MLRGTVRRSVRRGAVGRLLIHRRPRRRPGPRLRTLRGRRSHVKSGSAVSVMARRNLQRLGNVGYALRKRYRYRVHGVARDGGICGRDALHSGWRGGGAGRPALIVHEERVVAGGGCDGGGRRQRLRVARSLRLDVAVTGAVHQRTSEARRTSIGLVSLRTREAQADEHVVPAKAPLLGAVMEFTIQIFVTLLGKQVAAEFQIVVVLRQ